LKVELLGFYGGDETHALSAWTSTARDITDEKRARIPALLEMLAQSDPPHTTPFEKSFLHFLVRCETATHIQMLKHRIGVSINGESARYKQLRAVSFHIPKDWPYDLQHELFVHNQRSKALYEKALERLEPEVGRKRAKESARFFLPYSSELNLDVSFNFNSFMHFMKLRNEENAQKEIQEVAQQMLELVRETKAFDASLRAFGW
jgi:flavin-dependent thymidylate synthase